MRGRRPTPTVLKELRGNPGKRRRNQGEPKPEGDLHAPPDWLTPGQQELWSHAIESAPRSMLKRIDRELLMIWAVAADTYRIATQRVAKFGLVTKSPQQGIPMQNLYLPILNKQAQIMIKVAAELGFWPASRSRVSTQSGFARPTESREPNELELMLEEGRRLHAQFVPPRPRGDAH